MSIFNRNKKNNEPAPVQKSAAPSSPKPIVDADDFFKDLDKKSKPKEVSFEVETPEVTGLREAPLPRPVSEINMVETDEAAAEALADKTAMVLGDEYGDINAVNVSVDTDEVLPDKTLQERTYIPFEIPEEEEAKPEFDPLDPDAFFRDIDRSKRRNKVKTTIEAPEVTGLRETPAAAPESEINEIAEEISTDSLRDKTLDDNSAFIGNINDVVISHIDTSVLRAEQISDTEEDT